MYIGIDLGGTNIAAGLVDDVCSIVLSASTPTNAQRGTEEVLNDIASLAVDLTEKAGLSMKDIAWLGIGSPGAVDSRRGKVIFAGNLPFHHTPVVEILKNKLNIDIFLGNDANAAALGEVYAGAAKAHKSVLLVTLGTGIGGGIVFDRRVYDGFNGCAGEIGHMVIVHNGRQCTCGRKGCFEAYASATGLINMTKDAMEANPDSLLHSEVKKDGKVSARTAFNAMRAGDKTGKQLVDDYIDYLSCGLSNLINILQPELVCLGGGVSNEGDALLRPLTEAVLRDSFDCGDNRTQIALAFLGNRAGIIGAAMLGK